MDSVFVGVVAFHYQQGYSFGNVCGSCGPVDNGMPQLPLKRSQSPLTTETLQSCCSN